MLYRLKLRKPFQETEVTYITAPNEQTALYYTGILMDMVGAQDYELKAVEQDYKLEVFGQ